MPAAVPGRATMSKSLVHGMVTIPSSFFAGAEDSAFQREEYAPDGRKVGRANVIKTDEGVQKDVTNTVRLSLTAALKDERITPEQFERASKFDLVETIGYGEIVRCVTTEQGLVRVDDDELQTLELGRDKDVAKIVCFMPLSILGTGSYVPESIMQVRPRKEKGKSNTGYDKAFAVLLKGMRSRAVFALVEIVAHGKVKYGALMATGRLWLLKYDDEVREDLPLPAFDDVTDDEVRMMGTLIDTATENSPRVLEDVATTLAWNLVERKLAEGDVFLQVEGAPQAPATQDIMASLQASVEAAKAARTGESSP